MQNRSVGPTRAHLSEVPLLGRCPHREVLLYTTSNNIQTWKVIDDDETKRFIKQLRNSAPGPDNIHNRMLKNNSKLLLQHITCLFNAIIKIGYIAKARKKAHIILILKPNKNKQDPSSFRPISLLSCIGKLLEKIMKKRLSDFLEERNLLPKHQAGFRPGKSTIYNIIRLERFAQHQIDQNRKSGAIMFDIKAAFDSVWHDGFIYKMFNMQLHDDILKYLIAFLKDRTAITL